MNSLHNIIIRSFKTALTLTFFALFTFAQAQSLKSGDLLFVIEGNSDFSNAITSATGDSISLNFIHVAIYANKDSIIEASPRYGVRSLSLEQFLSQSPKVNGQPGVVVKRVKKDFPVRQAIDNAKAYIGQPYDWTFLPGNEMMYCSELVFESYKSSPGDYLFKSKPMNFRNHDGTMPQFWTALFEKLNIPIPEGEPGTNPNDMSKDEILMEIFRYF